MIFWRFKNAAEFWDEGSKHGFPPCCKARFILSTLRPHVFTDKIAPNFFYRLRKHFNLRHVLADGMVPCEYHALKYLVTGDKTGWRDRSVKPPVCCEMRRDLEEEGTVSLRYVQFFAQDFEGGGQDLLSEASFWVWMLEFPSQEGEPDFEISVHNCPWCGTALE